ncbi:MAG TPA: glutamate--tRNA ligase, partial [Baekduia sp.]
HELVEQFDVARVQKNPAQFDVKKLTWLNGRYVRDMSVDELTERLEAFTGRTGLRDAVAISQEKIATLADFWPLAGFLFDGPADDPAAREKWLDDGHRHGLVQAREALAHLDPFSVDGIEVALREVVEADPERKPKDVFQPIRVALAGTTVSPGIFESLATLGRDESLRRLDAALNSA